MFCGECGAQNPDTNQFCNSCGKPLTRRQPAVQPPALQAVPPAAPVQPSVTGAVPALTQEAPSKAPKRIRNWPGFVSLALGVLSWVILTGIFAAGAIVLGVISLVWFRKATGKTGISAIIAIILGVAAIVVTIALA
ncbi:MAG TPA: zinc-ribbon domain-containing protein [Methanoregula sp.]|nr:zinc-ribbon domain-containing protein [Methanoregula sp.]